MKTKVKGLCGEDMKVTKFWKIGKIKCPDASFFGVIRNLEMMCSILCAGCKKEIG